jgi:hypothetical protein
MQTMKYIVLTLIAFQQTTYIYEVLGKEKI